MNTNFQNDPWILSDEGFEIDKQLTFEKLYAVGNGYIRQWANFEEYYSGQTVLGTSIVGMALQNDDKVNSDTTSSSLVNAPNWTGVIVRLNEEVLDLASWEIHNFQRTLDMKTGVLKRTFEAISAKGHSIQVEVTRFLSLSQDEIGAIRYAVKSVNFEGRVSFMPIIDGQLVDENNETIWNVLQLKTQSQVAHLWTQIRHAKFQTCIAMTYDFFKNNSPIKQIAAKIEKEKQVGYSVGCDVKVGDTVVLKKYVAILDSAHYPYLQLPELSCEKAIEAKNKSWAELLKDHSEAWSELWEKSGLQLTGDANVQRKTIYKEFQNIRSSSEKKCS